MQEEIKEQLNAFKSGFIALLPKEIISCLRARDFLQFFSGDSKTIDVQKVKDAMKYGGKFNSNH